jgi:hypothetical protein
MKKKLPKNYQNLSDKFPPKKSSTFALLVVLKTSFLNTLCKKE